MKKILVLLLILFFVSGCLGSLSNLRKEKTPEIAYKRGIDINFKTNEGLPPTNIRLNDDFYISLNVINYAEHELNTNILVYDEYGNIDDSKSLILEGEPGYLGKQKTVTFEQPFRYTDKKLANKESNIIAEVETDNYPVEINSNIRVKKSGSTVSSNSLLPGNTLGRGASNAPITIDKIDIIQVNIPNTNDVDLKLVIYFHLYGGQINNDEEKIENFDIVLTGSSNPFDCKSYDKDNKFLVFKDKENAIISCRKIIDLGDQEYKDYPLSISFSYPYKISKSIKVKII
jgi:hypothetical protein